MSYDPQSLKDGIKAARRNIKTFRDAIRKEQETIKEYRRMIEFLERKEALQEGVEVERDGDVKH